MKFKRTLIIIAILGAVLAAGFFSAEVQAEPISEEDILIIISPKESCQLTIDMLVEAGIDRGSFWDSEHRECWLRTNVEGSTCYPAYEVWGVEGYKDGDILIWHWVERGCVLHYHRPEVTIVDPLMGTHMFPNGGKFKHEPLTCEGRCRIAVYALTDAAKRALGDAPGAVIGRAYIQIFDEFGDVDYGEFTFCLPHFARENLAFYRLGGGNQWTYLGGYHDGRNFCMSGTMSGNYILVDFGP